MSMSSFFFVYVFFCCDTAMFGVKQPSDEPETTSSTKRIKKRSNRQKISKEKKKKRTSYLETLKNEANKRLIPVEAENKLFTEEKTRFNLLDKLGRGSEDEAITHLKQAGIHYINVISLYNTFLRENLDKQQVLEAELGEVLTHYKQAKRKLISIQSDREKQEAASLMLSRRWESILTTPLAPTIPKRKKKTPLNEEELAYIKAQATLYTELYEEASVNHEAERHLLTEEEKYTKHKADAKAQKEILSKALLDHKKTDKAIRIRLSTFKSRNASFAPIVEEGSESIDLLDIDDEEEEEEEEGEEEDEGILSETVESNQLVITMTDVTQQLIDGNYDALRATFNEKYQGLFIENLIEMYTLKNQRAIDSSAHEYIGYLLDDQSRVISTLYEMLLAEEDTQVILAYLETVGITNVERRLNRLVSEAKMLTRTSVLKKIHAFIYDDEDEEEEEEEIQEIVIEEPIATISIDEEIKYRVLFSAYDDIKSGTNTLFSTDCVYTAIDKSNDNQPVIIRITPYRDSTEEEDEVHELLGTTRGFAAVREFFRVDHFPENMLVPCMNIKGDALTKPFTVYVTEQPAYDISQIRQFERMDKLCALYELLFALRFAKETYGIQHNDISLQNVRFRLTDETRLYQSGVSCSSPYMITLMNFEMASLEPAMTLDQRSMLSHADFTSFYNLVTHPEMEISPTLTKELRDALPQQDFSVKTSSLTKRPGAVSFALLLQLLEDEIQK